jgi:type III pantothenate kinase
MLLAIDIGNSSIGLGFFSPEGLKVLYIPSSPRPDSAACLGLMTGFMQQNHIEKKGINCIISSVVPELTGVLQKAVAGLSGAENGSLLVHSGLKTGLCLKIKAPELLGADRLTNAVAAYELSREAVAVVDAGTATTVTLIDSAGNLLGGAIMPGIGLMGSVLAAKTARLEAVAPVPPESAVGRETAEGIRAGLFFGTAGAVERIIEASEAETGAGFRMVLTGGFGQALERFIKRPVELLPHLIFDGMRLLYEKNRP